MSLIDPSSERRRAEIFRKGLVTAIDRTVVPWLLTIDGARQMPFINESITVGSVVLWVDQPDPFAWVPFGPKIWLSTTMRGGATTWTALDGDTRTLHARVAEGTADGGLVVEPNVLAEWYLTTADETDPGPGVIELVIDLTCWWTSQGDATADASFPVLADWNGAVWIIPPRYDGLNTTPHLIATDTAGNTIELDPTTVGIGPFGRGLIRITYNQASGATEAELSADGTAWVSQGTATFGNGDFGGGFAFTYRSEWGETYPAHWDPYVIHAFQVKLNGALSYGFTEAQLIALNWSHTPGVRWPDGAVIGDATHDESTSVDSDVAIAPYGAPIFTPEGPAGTVAPIFTDGTDLADPAIVYSYKADPGNLQVVTGVQPHDWAGQDGDPGASVDLATFVWAVCDRATFAAADIDGTTGWPTGWWPFGTRTT